MARVLRSDGGARDLGAQPGPAARGALDGDRPVERGEAVVEAAQAGAAARVRAADAVIGNLYDDAARGVAHGDARPRGVRVLRDVLERLGGDEVRRALDGAGQPGD